MTTLWRLQQTADEKFPYRILHQQLAELATYPNAALVIEAPYGHFLEPKRVAPWPATHVARARFPNTTPQKPRKVLN